MFFLIVFSLAIAGITITELPIVIILLRSPAIILFFFSKKKFLLYTGACFLALSSRQIYQRTYSGTSSKVTNSLHLSSGTIMEMMGSGKYLYTTQEEEFFLFSSKGYIPGNTIRLVGRYAIQTSLPLSLKQISWQDIFYTGFNGQKRLKMKGYTNMIYETNAIILQTGTIGGFSKIRSILQKKLEATYTTNRTASLVLGMLIGDKSKFSSSDYQLFVDSGLVHLVAVSGGNIVMLVTFLTAILFFLPFYLRITVILFAVVGYGMLCGMDSSVFRAVLMGSLSLFALLVGRSTSLWRLLGMVYIGMLLYDPYFLVYDVGYLLSFSAVLGIVFMEVFKNESGTTKKTNWGKSVLYGFWEKYLKPSIGATLGIFPIIIFFMGKINLGGIIGNMFVLPLVPFIMIGGFIGVFIPSGLQKYYVLGIDGMVKRTYTIATNIDKYGPTIVVHSSWSKFLFLGMFLVMIVVIIWTLTTHEKTKTIDDKTFKDIDKGTTNFYDDILSQLSVEDEKKG